MTNNNHTLFPCEILNITYDIVIQQPTTSRTTHTITHTKNNRAFDTVVLFFNAQYVIIRTMSPQVIMYIRHKSPLFYCNGLPWQDICRVDGAEYCTTVCRHAR